MNPYKLKADLLNFTGSESFHRHLGGMLYTEGVQYLAQHANCYWLLDLVAAHSKHDAWREVEGFVLVKLTVKSDAGLVVFDDGNGEILGEQKIEYTDFPMEEVRLYLCWNGDGYTLLLPNEY